MGGNSYDTYGEGSASTYWRRRFIVLAIGLVVFGLAAWGLSSALAVKSVPASRAASRRRPVDQYWLRRRVRVSRVRSTGSGSAGSGSAGSGSNDRSGHHSSSGSSHPGQSGRGRPGSGRPNSGQGRPTGRGNPPARAQPVARQAVAGRQAASPVAASPVQVRSAPSRKEAKQEPVRRPVTERSCRPSAVVVTSC